MAPGVLSAISPFRVWKELSFVWKYQIVFWTLFTIVSFPVHYIALRYVLNWQAPLYGIVILKVVETVIMMLVTVGFGKVMETPWFRRTRTWGKAGYICIMIAVISVVMTFVGTPLVTGPIYHHFGMFPRAQESRERLSKRFASHTYHVLLYGGWAWIFLLVRASVEGKKRERELHASELARKEAEILILRSQLNPHFLFNAMNSIVNETGGNAKLNHIVSGLSDYLRYSLANRSRNFVPFDEEIQATSSFLDLEHTRLGDMLDVELDIDPASLAIEVPGVLLQPLVENAIKYGMVTSPLPLRIRISTRCEDRHLVIEVANSGTWLSECERPAHVPGGVGLSNVKERLALFYPDSHRFTTHSENGWVTIRIELEQSEDPEGKGQG